MNKFCDLLRARYIAELNMPRERDAVRAELEKTTAAGTTT